MLQLAEIEDDRLKGWNSEETRRIAANITKLPDLLRKG
jgi:hypothetical protein